MCSFGKEEPPVCGGTETSYDENAPKTILSEEMILFDVTSVLPLGFVSAFAAPAGNGTFLFLETGNPPFARSERKRKWALVKKSVFPALTVLVREEKLAAENGRHSHTNGLPEDFGGHVTVRYASGENILFSCNQQPILSQKTGERIVSLLEAAMMEERVCLPESDSLRTVRFDEERRDGGFTRVALSIQDDGSGILQQSCRYSDPTVYESEKAMPPEDVAFIKQTVTDCGLLAWTSLPQSHYRIGEEKTLTFVFADGSQIVIPSDRVLPDQIRDGFFKIELEMTRGRV